MIFGGVECVYLNASEHIPIFLSVSMYFIGTDKLTGRMSQKIFIFHSSFLMRFANLTSINQFPFNQKSYKQTKEK